MDNTFEITVLGDGKISIRSVGGFSGEVHKDADEFLKFMLELAGGTVVTKKLNPDLGNPQHSHHHHHHKH